MIAVNPDMGSIVDISRRVLKGVICHGIVHDLLSFLLRVFGVGAGSFRSLV